ncbi:5-formyltetrahydrofolate cyclo-ligase [Candidatus Micrarchaeota archaeon CG11_big_fil_rev_8_21_14_0_20_47_5]|nr:MAG: 5-formyltetrahydrofolate cyclo-ligase [Candidatus Micrarchaeota archaeon CG1_02_47_40]PIN83801.1 MAG: 5-formyltetrahydrofolate cyclo-ligase [Candidatus Micrarchaeota archaeon CG11_big_fil_rev_8_21_14_0_20_47_5]
MEKKEIRESMQKERLLHSDAEKRKKSKRIMERLLLLPEFDGAKKVLLYLSKNYEVRTDDLVLRTIRMGKEVFLPRTDMGKSELEICSVKTLDSLVRGAYDVLEPSSETPAALPKEVECAIIPGAAFDEEGNRIGHGKGYYDRFLKKLKPNTPKIGLAFEFQLTYGAIPVQGHDIGVDYIITEERVIQCRKGME